MNEQELLREIQELKGKVASLEQAQRSAQGSRGAESTRLSRWTIVPLLLAAFAVALLADTLTIPNTFTSGTSISSSQMNANFDAVKTVVNGNIASDNLKSDAASLAKVSGGVMSTPGNGSLNVSGAGASIWATGQGNTSLELRSTVGGTPYIDFANDAGTDYDARLILTGDDFLQLHGAQFQIVDPGGSGRWGALSYTPNGAFHIDSAGGGWTYINWWAGDRVRIGNGAAGLGTLEADTYIGKLQAISGNKIQFSWNAPNLEAYVDGGLAWYKSFIIDHPLNPEKYLVHATLEGPEAGVYYRGTARLQNGRVEIRLPEYFEALTSTEGRTVMLTNIDGFDRLAIKKIQGEKIQDGRFVVVSDNSASSQEFDWEVKAIRKDVPKVAIEPDKDTLLVAGMGPYTFGIPTGALKQVRR